MEHEQKDVPYIVHEGAMARDERNIKRLCIALIISIILNFIGPAAVHIGWLVYENSFDTFYYEQDGDGLNNVNVGQQGDVIYGTESEVSP